MGKNMFNFGKNAKEKARQLKQTEKAAKRLMTKKQKADMANMSSAGSEIAEPDPGRSNASGVV